MAYRFKTDLSIYKLARYSIVAIQTIAAGAESPNVSRNFMKYQVIVIFFLLFSSCDPVPPMHTGPDPHSIKFNKAAFGIIEEYFTNKKDQIGFKMEKIPEVIPTNLITIMKDIGFLEFRNLGKYKVFFCGYGVVGKGWGFILGDFTDEQINNPSLIEGNNHKLYLTYIEKLEDKWYRFAAN